RPVVIASLIEPVVILSQSFTSGPQVGHEPRQRSVDNVADSGWNPAPAHSVSKWANRGRIRDQNPESAQENPPPSSAPTRAGCFLRIVHPKSLMPPIQPGAQRLARGAYSRPFARFAGAFTITASSQFARSRISPLRPKSTVRTSCSTPLRL